MCVHLFDTWHRQLVAVALFNSRQLFVDCFQVYLCLCRFHGVSVVGTKLAIGHLSLFLLGLWFRVSHIFAVFVLEFLETVTKRAAGTGTDYALSDDDVAAAFLDFIDNQRLENHLLG